MCGDLSVLVKSAKKNTYLCVAVVNYLGDSDESPISQIQLESVKHYDWRLLKSLLCHTIKIGSLV